jgi:hypothetical protein
MVNDGDTLAAERGDIAGMTSFSFTAVYPAEMGQDLAAFLTELGAVGVRLSMLDALGLESEPSDVDLVAFTDAFFEDECDDQALCVTGLTCGDGATCEAEEAVVTACEAATEITIETPPTTEPFTHTAMGTVETDPGVVGFEAPCAFAPGTPHVEDLYSIEIPAPMSPVAGYSLEVRLDGEGSTKDDDTVLHLRSNCLDPGSSDAETLCNDDIDTRMDMADMDYNHRSAVLVPEIAAGTWTIVVEQWGGSMMPLDYKMVVSLAPLLEAGAACNSEEGPRCITEECPAGEDQVCPDEP